MIKIDVKVTINRTKTCIKPTERFRDLVGGGKRLLLVYSGYRLFVFQSDRPPKSVVNSLLSQKSIEHIKALTRKGEIIYKCSFISFLRLHYQMNAALPILVICSNLKVAQAG